MEMFASRPSVLVECHEQIEFRLMDLLIPCNAGAARYQSLEVHHEVIGYVLEEYAGPWSAVINTHRTILIIPAGEAVAPIRHAFWDCDRRLPVVLQP